MKRFRRVFLIIMVTLIIVGVGFYAFTPHSATTPKQLQGVTELESYLNRLVDSDSPPGLSVDRVRSGNYAHRNL